jgi:hypothetical protein
MKKISKRVYFTHKVTRSPTRSNRGGKYIYYKVYLYVFTQGWGIFIVTFRGPCDLATLWGHTGAYSQGHKVVVFLGGKEVFYE